MKRFFLFTLVAIALFGMSGCSSKNASAKKAEAKKDDTIQKSEQAKTFYDAYATIPKEKIMNATSSADIGTNISDVKVMYDISPDIALVQVESIDGGSTLDHKTGNHGYAYTYGKIKVLEVYKGNLTAGQEVEYVRMGGIVPFEEYLKGLYPSQREKIESGMAEKPEYVEMRFEEDISVEVGVTYLAYLDNQDVREEGAVIPIQDAYVIVGWEGGLRKAQGDPKMKSELKVYNNFTGNWDFLHEVVSP